MRCLARTSCKRHSYVVVPVWSLSEAGFPIPLFPGKHVALLAAFRVRSAKDGALRTGSFFPVDNADGAWNWPVTTIEVEITWRFTSTPSVQFGVIHKRMESFMRLVATGHQRILMVATLVMGWLRALTIGGDQHVPQIHWHHCHQSQYMMACHIGTYTLWHYFAVSYVWTKGVIRSETSVIFSLVQDAILVRFCSEYQKFAWSQRSFFFSSS